MLKISNLELYCLKSLDRFAYILKRNGINMDLFYDNLPSLGIKYITDNNLSRNATATYDCTDNEIILSAESILRTSIFHELFHMASTCQNEDYLYSGFMEASEENTTMAGVGINEGMTELLSKIYFNSASSYYFQRLYMKKIIELIGYNQAEKAYFEADVNPLVDSLMKYDSEENILTFITILDNYTFLEQDSNSEDFINPDNQALLNTCSDYLVKWYANKAKQENLDSNLVEDYIEDFYCIEMLNSKDEKLNSEPTKEALDYVYDMKVLVKKN